MVYPSWVDKGGYMKYLYIANQKKEIKESKKSINSMKRTQSCARKRRYKVVDVFEKSQPTKLNDSVVVSQSKMTYSQIMKRGMRTHSRDMRRLMHPTPKHTLKHQFLK
mmetsp:Transcript_3920/g.4542  ORF Transcript_3920/g.4542 Transcript_3920/m.4542 type:complete len:108 (+) Transcript_3920:182-505(+)